MNLIEKFKTLVASGENHSSARDFRFTKNEKTILRYLLASEEKGTLVGVYCPAFGEGLFLTAVEKFHSENEIEFYMYDTTGLRLLRNVVTLQEVRMVCPFSDPYVNPLLKKLNKDKVTQ
jgi:hypothetical protein